MCKLLSVNHTHTLQYLIGTPVPCMMNLVAELMCSCPSTRNYLPFCTARNFFSFLLFTQYSVATKKCIGCFSWNYGFIFRAQESGSVFDVAVCKTQARKMLHQIFSIQIKEAVSLRAKELYLCLLVMHFPSWSRTCTWYLVHLWYHQQALYMNYILLQVLRRSLVQCAIAVRELLEQGKVRHHSSWQHHSQQTMPWCC